MMRTIAITLCAGLCVAGPALAEAAAAPDVYRAAVLRHAISPTGPSVAPRRASAIETAVLPARSVDRRLGVNGPVASAGFLCGLQEGVSNRGSASAAGWDPHGRFVGAKLTFAFR